MTIDIDAFTQKRLDYVKVFGADSSGKRPDSWLKMV
jgi:hypothetical protein